jgi:phosphoesterase RecJ-like protein
LNIDHHPTNQQFGRLNLVIPEAVATAETLAQILPIWPGPPQVADALLTGMVTDTVGFRTANMNPAALRVVADLMEAGGDLPRIYYPALVQRSFPAARYWGAGLAKLQREGRLVWTSLALEERYAAGYPDRDDADLVNVLSAIEGMDLALIFVEQAPDHVKISWRVCGLAPAELDVSGVAQQFGGGGHRAAAGAEMTGSLAEVQEMVLAATRKLLT